MRRGADAAQAAWCNADFRRDVAKFLQVALVV